TVTFKPHAPTQNSVAVLMAYMNKPIVQIS
ncbi:unnamed protein product, partial [marine sediment metagenome]